MLGLGRHSQSRQKRRIIRIVAVMAAIGFIAYLAWPSGPQVASRAPSDSISGTPDSIPYSGTPAVPNNSANTPVTSGNGGIPTYSNTAGSGGNPTSAVSSSGVAIPPAADAPAAPPTATTTTVPLGATVTYAAYVDPRFRQNPTNPLVVTYSYSAGASTVINGVSLELSSLPGGTLSLSANGNQICTMNVGGAVTGGTCVATFAAFGQESIVATYTTGSADYASATVSDDVEAFSTTTVAGIAGGGSLGGLVFYAAVTDSNGNAVTTGTASMTIADATQGWSYVVNATISPDGAHQNDFGCVLIENYPSVGMYGSFGNSAIVVSPATGDNLTITAVFAGAAGWGTSVGRGIYVMP